MSIRVKKLSESTAPDGEDGDVTCIEFVCWKTELQVASVALVLGNLPSGSALHVFM